MKLSLFGRSLMALFASLVLGLGMTACGGGTIGYMWVLGQEYNQIVGFKVDEYSGNLTEVPAAPFASNGSMPVSLVVKSGGRYVYVINQGVGGSAAGKGSGQSIALFSVGGDGTLTYQLSYQTQGYVSEWAQMDSSGSYLFVLDKYSPGLNTSTGLYNAPNTDGVGAITVFSSDATTGRLTLVLNAQSKDPDGINRPFFEVGASPFMMKSIAGCLYTVNGADQTISPYAIGSGGQLAFGNTKTFITHAGDITSINGGGSLVFLTDAASNKIFGYQSASGCTLQALNGGTTQNTVGTSNPSYSLLDAKNSYLYVLNQSSTNTGTGTTGFSSISAFFINPSNEELQEVSPGNTFTVGSNPVCMVEDPSSQYMYVSNHNDGTITGKSFNSTTGELAQLKHGSTFPATGQAGCLVISGATD
jgi:6-phosphogluconolactonase (cycloisomerase 2 family)